MKLTAQSSTRFLKGFTLIELLVVIAVIGVLAGAIIVAINPTEQLARAADAGRISSAQQVADAVNGYYAANQALPLTAGFITTVVNSGDLKVTPAIAGSASGSTCITSGYATAQNGYCYTTIGASPTNFVVYVMLKATANASRCGGTNSAFYAYSSGDAKSGVVCGTAGGVGPTVTALTFL